MLANGRLVSYFQNGWKKSDAQQVVKVQMVENFI